MLTNDSLHSKLLDQLGPELSAYLTKRSGDAVNLSRDDLLRLIFSNYRTLNGSPHGIRLSPLGNNLMSKKYNHYRYQHNGNVNNKAFIVLDKMMKWPYYLGRNTVTFYSEDDAAWFRLNGNDLNNYVEFL